MATDNVRLVYIRCFKASENMLRNFKVPKEKSSGSYEVKCMISAFNPTSTEAHIYAEFERMKSNLLQRALERHGATEIGIESFTLKDYLTGSGKALRYVLTEATKPGFQLIERGSPSVAPAPVQNPSHDTELNAYSLDIIKALEQTVNQVEERAQKLEEELDLKDKELGISEDERKALILKIQELEASFSKVPAFNQVEYDSKVAELDIQVKRAQKLEEDLASKDNALCVSDEEKKAMAIKIQELEASLSSSTSALAEFNSKHEATMRAMEKAERKACNEMDKVQHQYLNLIADDLKELCGGRNSSDEKTMALHERVDEHLDSLWKSMASGGSKVGIARALHDVINKVHSLRAEARQVELRSTISESKLCSSCGGALGGKGRKRQSDDFW